MIDVVLIINAGSSSIKFALYRATAMPGASDHLCEGACDGIGHEAAFHAVGGDGQSLLRTQLRSGATHGDAIDAILAWIRQAWPQHRLVAAGHRVVHGGPNFSEPVLIDQSVRQVIESLVPLAPLHQPHHLAAIEALTRLDAGLPQVACFDTAFHHGQSAEATGFALPQALTDEGVRRYGFHGLSYEFIASALDQYMPSEVADGRVVVAHLGSGASMCALYRRRSVATTMGFTALDGLPMSRRCGNLDPGVVLYLMQHKGMSTQQVSDLLYHDSGLWGVSGVSDDMRDLLGSAEPGARRAIDLFVYRVGRELGSLSAALGGLDALVFTAGIGVHAAEIREQVCRSAAWLGVALDSRANNDGGPRLTHESSRVSAWVIPTDEDLMIARHTCAMVAHT